LKTFSKNIEGCRDGSAQNHMNNYIIHACTAVCKQDGAKKDYTNNTQQLWFYNLGLLNEHVAFVIEV